ncbi:MAG: putative lipid II flippase FtsW [Candidatus Nanopelagicales bacterium]
MSRSKTIELNTYYAILISTLSLLAIGLVMVLSASTEISFTQTGNQYEIAIRQLLFATLGLILMFITSRLPLLFFTKWANWIIAFAIGLLVIVLVPSIGVSVAGQRNWLIIYGSFRLQPSEFAKLALIIWGAAVLSQKMKSAELTWSQLLSPVYWVGLLITALVVAQGDVGTALIILPIVLALYYAAGAPLILNAANALLGVLAIAVLTLQAPYRMQRWLSWRDPAADPEGAGWQIIQGQYALAEGGIFGLGLGASRQKWGWLPAAHTDFIFAVIGEELGLVGTFFVLFLFLVIIISIITVARKTKNYYTRIYATGLAGWILIQSVINLGGVLGLLPITGVPLPLISYGGSSLIFILISIGGLLACVRNEPALKAKRQKAKVSSKK